MHMDTTMKNKYIIIISVLLLIHSAGVYAQNSCSISGTVLDADGETISYATAVLYDGDKIIAGTLSDENGRFQLSTGRSSVTKISHGALCSCHSKCYIGKSGLTVCTMETWKIIIDVILTVIILILTVVVIVDYIKHKDDESISAEALKQLRIGKSPIKFAENMYL